MVVDGGGEVLGEEGGAAVEVGEVVELEVAGLAGVFDGAEGVGVDDLGFHPRGGAVGLAGAGGVGLGGEFGHAVFVVDAVGVDEEGFGEAGVEVFLGDGGGEAFVAAGFEEVAAFGEREGGEAGGAEGFEEAEEAEGGAEDEDGFVFPPGEGLEEVEPEGARLGGGARGRGGRGSG